MTSRPLRGVRGRLVYLRPLEPEDADLVASWYADDRFRALMGDPPMSAARRRHRYEQAVTEDGSDVIRWMICRLEDDRPVGRLDLFAIDPTNGNSSTMKIQPSLGRLRTSPSLLVIASIRQ